LRDVLKKTRDLTDQLGRFDIFSEIEAGLESSRGALADNKDVDLIIKVKEASRYFVRTATDVGDGEGNAVSPVHLTSKCIFF
jgi:outer membrane protein insertion porin family